MRNEAFDIVVLPGDGIGVEVMHSALAVLDAVQRRCGGFALRPETLPGGAGHYRDTGTALTEHAFARCAEADAVLFGAMGIPEIRYPDGTEIAPQLDLRVRMGLYAGVRPIRVIPGVPRVLAHPRGTEIDLVIIRESTEGLFAARGHGVMIEDREARDTMVITRTGSERVFDFAFRLAETRRARGRPGHVTCVDKAGVLQSMAFFRKIFHERAQHVPHLGAGHHNVDAAALDLVRRPWTFDVMVMENQFGDILSDIGAALVGGMGYAPSADIGDDHAVFQPCHGSAPDIAGTGAANPTAMILSAAMMLDWLGRRHQMERCIEAAGLIERAVDQAFASGTLRTPDAGGSSGTREVTNAILHAIGTRGAA